MTDGKTEVVSGQVLDRREIVEKDLLENIGKPLSVAMLDAGYSPAYSKNPQALKNTKTWQRVKQKYFNPVKIGAKYNQLLEASRLDKFVFSNDVDDETIKEVIEQVPGAKLIKISRNSQWARAFYTIPDNPIQAEMVKTGLKAWGMDNPATKTDPNNDVSQEVREVIYRVRTILPKSTL